MNVLYECAACRRKDDKKVMHFGPGFTLCPRCYPAWDRKIFLQVATDHLCRIRKYCEAIDARDFPETMNRLAGQAITPL